ncbi:hypothetical protein [Methylorubrum extorquens]|uniref:hypothetical protein n=1 Tax=Methylorubrum extorquens TaxID=408 RepID=UPI00209F08BF|nr:hypothetical protein [Methylorubrum extorquens]MCP1540092.1 hypothetical protein [Methylorubrum extorquens]
MTKFIKQIALRFAQCADYLEVVNDETVRAQRAHSNELQVAMRRAKHELSLITTDETCPAALRAHRQKMLYAKSRLDRRMNRSQQRHAKLMRQQALLAE